MTAADAWARASRGLPRSRCPACCKKPLRLVRRALLALTQEGDLVCDPFCGSGTTAVAAKELNRFFAGAELEEEFAEIAGRRIRATVRGSVLRKISEQLQTQA